MKKIFFLLILPFLLFSGDRFVPGCYDVDDGDIQHSCIYDISDVPSDISLSKRDCSDTDDLNYPVLLINYDSDYNFISGYVEQRNADSSCTSGYARLEGSLSVDDVSSLSQSVTVECDDGQVFDSETFTCKTSCPENSTLTDLGCVCNDGYVLLDGQCVPPCEETNPPLVNENNLPLQRVFANSNDCIDYIKNVAVNQNGQCVTFDGCGYVYGYFEIKDDVNTTDFNVTYIDDNGTLVLPPIVVSDDPLLDDTSDNDNNYTTLSTIDTNNSDNVDMTPVLKSLSDMSLANHNDFKNVADKIDTSNTQLVNMNSKLSDVNTKLDTVNKNISDTNNKLDSLISGDFFTDTLSFDGFKDFYDNLTSDISSVTDTFNSTLDTLENGFDTPSISDGDDPIFSTQVFGQTIVLDLCPSFSVFRPFFYFIFVFIFTILAIRIFWAGMKIGNRG